MCVGHSPLEGEMDAVTTKDGVPTFGGEGMLSPKYSKSEMAECSEAGNTKPRSAGYHLAVPRDLWMEPRESVLSWRS